MGLLNFLAMEPPQRAQVIQQQARDALGPFERYLFQARQNAEERQKRHRFAFEVVRRKQVFRLKPMDTLLLLPAKAEKRWRLDGWPATATFDISRKVNNLTQEGYFAVQQAVMTSDGLLIETDAQALQSGDLISWCGQQCTLKPASRARRPEVVTDTAGRSRRVRWHRRDGDDDIVCLEGQFSDEQLIVDGQSRSATPLPPWSECSQARDSKGTTFPVHGEQLRTEAAPVGSVLEGNCGVRFTVEPMQGRVRSGNWVQLLLPDDFAVEQALIDPRAEFCEGEQVREIWTAPFRRDARFIQVYEVDRDRYQLRLKELPPTGTTHLYAPLDTRAIDTQKRAVQQLRYSPLPSHRGLIRLCENPDKVRWPHVPAISEPEWELLIDDTIDGTAEQREFVRAALASTDLCLLQGPPGSGKTTAICELVYQAIRRGERVLLCASTHVAIDNALEKLYSARPELIEAVRIGIEDRVDEKVKALQIDRRIDDVLSSWHSAGLFGDLSEDDRREAAASIVVMSANLTCGTTAGILNHPQLRSARFAGTDRPLTTFVPWDLMIIDEASKTTVPEFLVPALLARRHVIVGDVQQLPPFTNIEDLEANVAHVSDSDGNPLIPAARQRARLLKWRLTRDAVKNAGVRWLVAEPRAVLDHLESELGVVKPEPVVVRVGRGQRTGRFPAVTPEELKRGSPSALIVNSAQWLLVDQEVWRDVADYLPPGVVVASSPSDEIGAWAFRHAAALNRFGRITPIRERGKQIATKGDLETLERDFLSRRSWAAETAWRLKRVHELRWSSDGSERDRMKRGFDELVPVEWVGVRDVVGELRDIGLPSVIEVIQEGVGSARTRRRNALAEGLRNAPHPGVFESRFTSLSFQHRMHPEISDYPREVVYKRLARSEALLNAGTIAERDRKIKWDFEPTLGKRRVWIDVRGSEHRGVNEAEVRATRRMLDRFLGWAQRKGPPAGRRSGVWEVACLCFYLKQEEALSEMVRDLVGSDARHCFLYPDDDHPLVEIRCGTVDRFQGREADLVLLSMRNTRRVGFLDSPNRLNVAVTRARQQLVIFGDYGFFSRDDRVAAELRELATMTRTANEDGKK